MRQIFSDLNLNGDTPARVQPVIGEWGPQRLPSTSAKKRARFTVSLAFIAAAAALFWLGKFFFDILMGATG